MNYTKDPLLILNEIRKKDDQITALFVFGSFVLDKTSHQNYQEIRIYDGNKFILSRFKLLTIQPDIDIICVSNNPNKTEEIIKDCIGRDDTTHYLTINILSKDVFESEAFSDQPKAIRRIILFRKLLIIKGEEYVSSIKNRIINMNRTIDKEFQEEYDFIKEYLRLFAKHNIDSFSINHEEYERLFPNFLKFITGKIDAGFPKERIKLVLPRPTNLKAELDISKTKLKFLD